MMTSDDDDDDRRRPRWRHDENVIGEDIEKGVE